jgi:hypothetical protein
MLGGVRMPTPKRGREDGEKPFWISFSDLMSALMVLFLVAMSVALLAVTNKVSQEEREDRERIEAIEEFRQKLKDVVSQNKDTFEGVQIIGNTVDFGSRGLFEREGQNVLSGPQRALLREFTPILLDELRKSDAGKKWFKRAVVEGYASQSGTYLKNLNLSLERSQRVICDLLGEPLPGEVPLSEGDRKLIATKFFVGGASFNSLRATPEDSRRIEFKLEFKTRQERIAEDNGGGAPFVDDVALTNALTLGEKCQIRDR